ncbi:MAG: penicillin-binding protein 2 [Proteobacteria bacterium]|nr:penicillin-binding protein 2 [Pseudomonadota bacterium]
MIFSRENQKIFRVRASSLALVVSIVLAFLLLRLAWLQIVEHEKHSSKAEDNRVILLPQQAPRGMIFDRNQVVMARNDAGFYLELQPSKLEGFQKTIKKLREVIEITRNDVRKFNRLRKEVRSYDGLPLRGPLSNVEVAKLVTRIQNLPGVAVRPRLIRSYPLGLSSSHILGHIGRISEDDLLRQKKQNNAKQYRGFTHIGKLGVEESYEHLLRGKIGYQHVEVTAGGKMIRELNNSLPVPGKSIALTIDAKLQRLVEDSFGKRKGGLVAIEPSTGEILAFVSMPNFDPNAFIDGVDQKIWEELNTSPDKPLLNRPLKGLYPPGSTYKPFMALAALSSGAKDPTEFINDPGYFVLGNHKFRDSSQGGHGQVDMRKSIVVSSDTYYYKLAIGMGVDLIHEYISPFGFGKQTGVDLSGEARGILPSSSWKLKRHGTQWLQGETPSIGIGQGYNIFTILQMAKATSIIANRGVMIKPRLFKGSRDFNSSEFTYSEPVTQGKLNIQKEWFDFVIDAMVEVNKSGTASSVFGNSRFPIAGKTGTAQVFTIKQDEEYDSEKVPERLKDHSLYIGFAPVDKPKIAVAVVVENGGFGVTTATPIAKLVFDFYLAKKTL